MSLLKNFINYIYYDNFIIKINKYFVLLILIIIYLFNFKIIFKINPIIITNNFEYYPNINDTNLKIYNLKMRNNSILLYYFNFSIDNKHLNNIEKYYKNTVLINSTFLDNIEYIEKNIDFFLLNLEKTKIENIFILIILFPFLKTNTSLIYKIENRNDYKIFRNIFKSKNIKKLNRVYLNNLTLLFDQFYDLIFNEWEILPEQNLLNTVRFIINSYYNESFLKIFDKSLNINLKLYIENANNINFDIINKLMSKFN